MGLQAAKGFISFIQSMNARKLDRYWRKVENTGIYCLLPYPHPWIKECHIGAGNFLSLIPMQKEFFKAKPMDLTAMRRKRMLSCHTWIMQLPLPASQQTWFLNRSHPAHGRVKRTGGGGGGGEQNLTFTYCKTRTANSIKRLWRHTPLKTIYYRIQKKISEIVHRAFYLIYVKIGNNTSIPLPLPYACSQPALLFTNKL